MKLKFIALSLFIIASANVVNAQYSNKVAASHTGKNEIRLSVSDGLTLVSVDIFGMGLADATLGSKRTDQKATLVYGIGYRREVNRFRLGCDFGFAQTTSKLTLAGDSAPSIKERELNFLILPTVEFTYYRHGVVELYGGASAGVDLIRHMESGLNDAGKKLAQKANLSASFAYQVNPIAIRLGNNRIGGFLEAGLGHKGFLTAGVSMRF